MENEFVWGVGIAGGLCFMFMVTYFLRVIGEKVTQSQKRKEIIANKIKLIKEKWKHGKE